MIEIDNQIKINNQPFKIISGTIHYFRVVPEYWEDRLLKLKKLGCNTVETYIPWNIHEPYNGEYQFTGMYDVEEFIKLANRLGLYIILRPSPYICAEWEFGGLPYWLLKESNIRLRTPDMKYFKYVERFFDILIPKLAKYQLTKGGNVILFQVENEYGYYGNDKEYLKLLKNNLLKNGIDVPLVTSDGPWGEALECGNLAAEGVLPTLNFGSKAVEHYNDFRLRYPNKPFFCMEFWIGWFDAEGEAHHLRDPKECAAELKSILDYGHVNIYVFHGGTNFGYLNGANYDQTYMPLVTSYDYDALLTENGLETAKYYEFQKVIKQFNPTSEKIELEPIAITAYPQLEAVGVYDALSNLKHIAKCVESKYPLSFEQLDYPFGYIYYETKLSAKREIAVSVTAAHDRISYYQNRSCKLATQFDNEIGAKVEYSMTQGNEKLGLLVENAGRLNFGHKLDQQCKGITGNLVINNHIHCGIKQYCLDFHDLANLESNSSLFEGPTISHFILSVTKCIDTYIDVASFGKGIVIVNDEVIGKFTNNGPQTRLYLPGPKLKTGSNHIYIFETEGIRSDCLKFATEPKWSKIASHDAVEN